MANIEHKDIPDGERHEPKGISGATSGQVYAADGAGSGSWVANFNPSRVVDVESKDDFPTPIAGSIYLEDDTIYLVRGEVDIGTDKLVIQAGYNVEIQGYSNTQDFITYTGTDIVVDASAGCFLSMRNVGWNSPDTRVCRFTTVVTGEYVIFDRCLFRICAGVLEATDAGSVTIQNCISLLLTEADAVTFSGTCSLLRLVGNLINSWEDTLLQLGTSTWDLIEVADNTLVLRFTDNLTIDGLPNSGNFNTDGAGVISANVEAGEVTTLSSNIGPTDLLWTFSGNNRSPDSQVIGEIAFTGNTATTTINTTGVYEDINATYTLSPASERMSMPVNGVLQVDSKTPSKGVMLATVSLERAAGPSAVEVSVAVFRDDQQGGGFVKISSDMTAEVATDTTNVVVGVLDTLVEGYTYKVMVANNTDTNDLVVTSLQFGGRL